MRTCFTLKPTDCLNSRPGEIISFPCECMRHLIIVLNLKTFTVFSLKMGLVLNITFDDLSFIISRKAKMKDSFIIGCQWYHQTSSSCALEIATTVCPSPKKFIARMTVYSNILFFACKTASFFIRLKEYFTLIREKNLECTKCYTIDLTEGVFRPTSISIGHVLYEIIFSIADLTRPRQIHFADRSVALAAV